MWLVVCAVLGAAGASDHKTQTKRHAQLSSETTFGTLKALGGDRYEFSSAWSGDGKLDLSHGIEEVTITKKIPVPVPVQVERQVPVAVPVPFDQPYPVFIPKPIPLAVHKPVPYEIKVPYPKPFIVEKHVAVPASEHQPKLIHMPPPEDKPVFPLLKKFVQAIMGKNQPRYQHYPQYAHHYPHSIEKQVIKHIPYPVERYIPVPYKVKVPVPVEVNRYIPIQVPKDDLPNVLDSSLLSSPSLLSSLNHDELKPEAHFSFKPELHSSLSFQSEHSSFPFNHQEYILSGFDSDVAHVTQDLDTFGSSSQRFYQKLSHPNSTQTTLTKRAEDSHRTRGLVRAKTSDQQGWSPVQHTKTTLQQTKSSKTPAKRRSSVQGQRRRRKRTTTHHPEESTSHPAFFYSNQTFEQPF